ncbi:hypothetical protein NLY09_14300 (plasmid) [Burkholderia vietnamiensis]
MNGLIREMRPMPSRADNGGGQVELSLQPGEKVALVDAALFEAALPNLLVDAMPSRGTVTIGTDTVDGDPQMHPGAGARPRPYFCF